MIAPEDICTTCGLKLKHWYHYYSDIYGSFLFHRCPKITLDVSQRQPKLATGCWYYTKFVLWFILIPFLTVAALVRALYKVFAIFCFQPVHFEYKNMDRRQQCRWRVPIYFLYVLLALLLVALELVVPFLITIFILPVSYFVHIYGFVRHRKHNANVRRYMQIVRDTQQSLLTTVP